MIILRLQQNGEVNYMRIQQNIFSLIQNLKQSFYSSKIIVIIIMATYFSGLWLSSFWTSISNEPFTYITWVNYAADVSRGKEIR